LVLSLRREFTGTPNILAKKNVDLRNIVYGSLNRHTNTHTLLPIIPSGDGCDDQGKRSFEGKRNTLPMFQETYLAQAHSSLSQAKYNSSNKLKKRKESPNALICRNWRGRREELLDQIISKHCQCSPHYCREDSLWKKLR
jgi:hypothetical protein